MGLQLSVAQRQKGEEHVLTVPNTSCEVGSHYMKSIKSREVDHNSKEAPLGVTYHATKWCLELGTQRRQS